MNVDPQRWFLLTNSVPDPPPNPSRIQVRLGLHLDPDPDPDSRSTTERLKLFNNPCTVFATPA